MLLSLAQGFTPTRAAVRSLGGDAGSEILVVADSAADGGLLTTFDALGSGGWAETTELAIGSGPVAVLVGDLNRDGRLDVVTVSDSPTPPNLGSIVVLFGQRGGGLAPPIELSTSDGVFPALPSEAYLIQPDPAGAVLGLLSSDGGLDLLISHGPGSLGVVGVLANTCGG